MGVHERCFGNCHVAVNAEKVFSVASTHKLPQHCIPSDQIRHCESVGSQLLVLGFRAFSSEAIICSDISERETETEEVPNRIRIRFVRACLVQRNWL
jgi:hypothetical protein